MEHPVPGFQRDVYTGFARLASTAHGIVQQDFIRPHLDQQRRQALQIGVQGGKQRLGPPAFSGIVPGVCVEIMWSQNGIDPGFAPDRSAGQDDFGGINTFFEQPEIGRGRIVQCRGIGVSRSQPVFDDAPPK